MLSSLLLFLVYSIPPLAGWRLCFRARLGRRRFRRSLRIPASPDAVWAALDPRGPCGGWTFLYETCHASLVSQSPLVLRLDRRPQHSGAPFERIEEECVVEEAARRMISRRTRAANGASCEVALSENGAGRDRLRPLRDPYCRPARL